MIGYLYWAIAVALLAAYTAGVHWVVNRLWRSG